MMHVDTKDASDGGVVEWGDASLEFNSEEVSQPCTATPTCTKLRTCTFPNIRTKWKNTLHNGLWTQLHYWLAMLSWQKSDQHSHIPNTDPPTTPSSQGSQSLGTTIPRFEIHVPPRQPTTYKAASINYKPSNNDNNYSHPLGNSFIRLVICGTLD
jgi:hypothetical protein